MKAFLSMAFILALASTTLADQVILIYAQGNTLFSQGAGKTIRSNTMCSDPEVRRLLGKYDMSYGHQMSSGIVDLLDGYYLFSIGHGKGKEAADSLRAAQYVNTAAVNGSVHFLSGSRREPKDYWYNHTFKWAFGHHHYGCENPTYMPIPHYRQWHLPRGHYDRAWTVTVGDSSNVIAIIDSSFEIDHPDLMPLWAWNTSESADSIDTDANGYPGDTLGWDFGDYYVAGPKYGIGDSDIGHDQRWWEIMPGCTNPWACECDTSWCVCDSTSTYCDENEMKNAWGSNRHGTNMSSIISAQSSESDSLGLAGINWKTKLLPVKIGNQIESRIDVPDSLWASMLKALEYVAIRKSQGLNIIALNMSLTFDGIGNLSVNEDLRFLFDDVFDDLRSIYGILPVGAAGNFRRDEIYFPIYPCRNEDVFCATCVGYYHQQFDYSQYLDNDFTGGLPLGQENVDLCAFGAVDNDCGVNLDPYDEDITKCIATPAGDRFMGQMMGGLLGDHPPSWMVGLRRCRPRARLRHGLTLPGRGLWRIDSCVGA